MPPGFGQHACNGRQRPHLGARFLGVRKIGDLRIGQRADRATDMAPAIIDAGRPALEFGRVHADRRRHHTDAGRFAALLPNITIAKGFHRRHRIGFTLRPPNFLSLGIAGHANLRRNLVIVGRDVRIRDRPVEAAIVFTLHLEIVRHVAREIREIVQRRTANTPAGLIGVAVRILALEQKWNAGRFDLRTPKIRAD